MVGKTPVKKQLVSRHERTSESIRIPDDPISENVEEWKELLQNMNKAINSTEQNKLLQGVKRKFRTVLLDNTRDQVLLQKLHEYFLFLYLHPTFFAFRTSLEWIVSCTRDLVQPWGKTQVQESISKVSEKVWESLFEEVGRDTLTVVSHALMQRWIVTFNAIVTLDREFDWINDAKSHSFTRHDLIYYHARFLSSLLSSDDVAAKSLLVAKENIRFISLATDVMRNLGSLLRPLLDQERGRSLVGLDKIAGEAQLFLQQIDYSASKDLVANSAILLATLYLLSSEAQYTEVIPAFIDLVLQPVNTDITALPSVVNVVQALSRDVVMKSAFLRALFTLVPDFPSYDSKWLEGKEVVGFMVGHALQGDSFTQLFHLHSLSLYLHTLHKRGVSEVGVFVDECLVPNLWSVIKGGWKHPNRLVTHIIPDIFQSFLQLIASAAAVATEVVRERQWRRCIEEVMSMPSFHRSKYEALTHLLSHLTARSLLYHRPHLLEELLNAVHDRNIASSVSSLFLLLCQKIDEEESQEVAEVTRGLLRQSLCRALASDVPAVRANISDYLLPELCSKVRTVFAPFSLLCFYVSSSPTSSSEGVGWLWAVVQLVWQCKLSVGAADYALLEKSEEVEVVQVRERVFQAMMSAAVHIDDSLRLMTLQAISASLKTTMPLYDSEVVLMQRSLTYSLKTSEVDDCAKLGRAIKQWLLRAKLSNLTVYESLMTWLFSLLSDDWIPTDTGDLPADKEFSLLTILSIMIEVGTNNSSSNTTSPTLDPTTQTLLSRHRIVPRLLLTFLSNYEKSRRLAHDLLAQLPSPWQSYAHNDTLAQLWKWTESLLTSAKLKESNAGAQLTSLLFRKYALHLGWHVFSQCEEVSKEVAVKGFIHHLSGRCEEVLEKLKEVFRDLQLSYLSTTDNQEKSGALGLLGNFPLAHGYLLALRYCSALLLNNTTSEVTSEVSRELVQRIFSLALTSLSSGMEVIAHPPHSEEDEVSEGAKGPLGSSVAYSMAATYVNTNSFSPMEGETGELGGTGEDTTEEGMGAQRAIVAAWLLVKESTSLLAALAPAHDHLSTEDLTMIGDRLLDALGRLKHMGAISEAYTALQSVATTYLRYGNKQPTLSALPQLYLERLITRLNQQQQVFILRRSAGFAYSFLALLHAEPLNAQPILLHYTMRHLLDIVERGTSPNGVEEGLWKLSVHALNVVRSILLDSAFHGKELDIFIPRIMQFIILGFSSSIWSIRNSSMMSFSAIVQRMILRKEQKKSAFSMALQHQSSLSLASDHLTVSSITNLYPLIPSVPSPTLSELDDHDINEDGTSKKVGQREIPDIGGTMTIAEFFKRFPSLLPLLLSLLSEEVQQRIPSHNIPLEEKRRVLSESADRHSLYAILLLFSKFTLLINQHSQKREEKEGENDQEKELDLDIVASTSEDSSGVNGFVVLVEHCLLHHTNPLIRAVAAKAFTKLIPVNSFLSAALSKTADLISTTQKEGGSANANEVHGRLLQITELITQFTNYRILFPPTTSPSGESGNDEEILKNFHASLLNSLQPFAFNVIMKSLHPMHSLAVVQILQQYAALLVLPTPTSHHRQERRKMVEEVQLMKYEFIAEYAIRTRRCYTLLDQSQSSQPLVLPPSFPYSLQHLLEILCREQPFLALNTTSGVVVRWWEYVVGEEVLSRWLREGKIAVLSGALHFLTYHEPTSVTEKENKTIEKFIGQVVDRIELHLTRGREIRGGRDDAVVTLLLIKVFHRYLLTWDRSLSILSRDKKERLIHQIFRTLLNPSNTTATTRDITIEKLLEEIEMKEGSQIREKELGDENQIPYLIQIVTLLIFHREKEVEVDRRISSKTVMIRLWKEVLLRGKRKLFSSSIRFSVVRAIELSCLLHSSSDTFSSISDEQCEEVAVKWSLALLTIELLQDDGEEVREAVNHYLCTSVLRERGSGEKTVVVTVETKTTERMTSLLRDILSSLDVLFDVSKERKIAVVRAMIEEFHLLHKELSLTMTNTEEVVRDLLSPSAVAHSSQPQLQVIFEAEKGNLYINTLALLRMLQAVVFDLLTTEELSKEIREVLVERWLLTGVLERWSAVEEVLTEVQRQEREGVARKWKEVLGGNGRGSAVFQFFDLKIRFLAKWREWSTSPSAHSFLAVVPPHINPDVIAAVVTQSTPFLSAALWLEEGESMHSLLASFK